MSLQIEIKLPQIVVAPGGEDDALYEAGQSRKPQRADERLKLGPLGPLRLVVIGQQYGADLDRLFLPAEHPFSSRSLRIDDNDATPAGDDRLHDIIQCR